MLQSVSIVFFFWNMLSLFYDDTFWAAQITQFEILRTQKSVK
jgi:predicted membrane protein